MIRGGALGLALLFCAVGCTTAPRWPGLAGKAGLLERFPGQKLRAVHPYVQARADALLFRLCRFDTQEPLRVALGAGLDAAEQSAAERALEAWAGAGLGVRFEIVEADAEAEIHLDAAPEDVENARGRGAGGTDADCTLSPDGGMALESARVRVGRRGGTNAAGRARGIDEAELLGTLIHELGHALGFQGHPATGSVMSRELSRVRMTGRAVLDGRRFYDPTLAALYALPSGMVLARHSVSRYRTQLPIQLATRAEAEGFAGPFLRVGDRAARIFYRDDEGAEYGVQLANLREALRDPSRAVFLPEAEAKRLLESD